VEEYQHCGKRSRLYIAENTLLSREFHPNNTQKPLKYGLTYVVLSFQYLHADPEILFICPFPSK